MVNLISKGTHLVFSISKPQFLGFFVWAAEVVKAIVAWDETRDISLLVVMERPG